MTPDEWRDLPHLLAEYCDRCGGFRERICAFDRPNGVRSWYCKPCWSRAERDLAEQQAVGPTETLRAEREQLPVLAVDTPVMLAGDETRYRVHRYWPWGTDARESVLLRLLPIDPEAAP